MRFTFPLLLLAGCAPAIQSGQPPSQPVVTERIYFGRNIGDTLGVTDSLWSVFVREVVSARLPAGYTFWPASGGWRDSTGHVTREPGFVLEVVHPPSASSDSAIVALIAEYKRRFQQQSVLRVVTAGRSSF